MILLFKFTLFGLLLSLAYGWLFEFAIAKVFRLNSDQENHFSITILLGVSMLAGLLGIWSFFARVDLFTVRVFSITAIALLVLLWKYTLLRVKVLFQQLASLGPLSWLFLLAFLIYALYLASASDVTYDTGLYHAQSIRWIETYPVVRGIANLHDRLGFNSNLFLLSAFWGFAYMGEHAYQVPGLVIFIAFALFCLYIIEKSRKDFKLSGVVAAGFFIYLLMEKGIILWFASPTADLSASFLSWVIFLLAMGKVESDQVEKLDMSIIVMVILSLFDLSIKLSTAPVFLVPLYFLWNSKSIFSLQILAGNLFFGLIVFLPWIARNIVVSGYLIFPFYQLDILNVDWKIPPETARHTAEVVTAWGRIPYEDPSAVISMNFGQWFPKWHQTLPPADSLLIGSVVVVSILLVISMLLSNRILGVMQKLTPIYLIYVLGIVYWFIQSPSPRFGYGFLVTLLLFPCALFIGWALNSYKISKNILILLLQIVLVIYTVNSEWQFPLKSWKHYLYSYKPFPVVDTRSVGVDRIAVFIPLESDQCWYDAFPCTPFAVEGLSMRSTKIEDGFYIKEK